MSCEHQITALGSALHGSKQLAPANGRHAATVEGLLDAVRGAKLTDDLEASEAVRDVLRQHEERAG